MRVIYTISLLCLIHLNLGKNIAIVGCGSGGAAQAYFLRDHNITIFEQNDRCGGRIQNVKLSGIESLEMGGTFFIDDNRYVKQFLELTKQPFYQRYKDETLGLFDKDNNVIFQTSEFDFFTLIKMLFRYGLSPLKIKTQAEQGLEKFLNIYDFQYSGQYFTNYDEFLKIVGLSNITEPTIREYLINQGVSEKFVDEFIGGMITGIYNQEHFQTSLVAGFVSIIGAFQKAYTVQNGNSLLFQTIVSNFTDSRLLLNHTVIQIDKLDDKFQVSYRQKNSHHINKEDFDIVILATLIHKENKILFKNENHNRTLEEYKNKYNYQNTYIYILGGLLNPEYFGYQKESDLPDSLMSIDSNSTAISEIYVVCKDCHENRSNIYKIQARWELQDSELSKLVKNHKLLKFQKWTPAYPSYKDKMEPAKIEIDENLFYINSMEQLASCMEMEIISARNIANIINGQFQNKKSSSKNENTDL